MIWPFVRRNAVGPSEDARATLRRSEHSVALARDLNARSFCVSEELRKTLDRNHIAATLEETMIGVRRR